MTAAVRGAYSTGSEPCVVDAMSRSGWYSLWLLMFLMPLGFGAACARPLDAQELAILENCAAEPTQRMQAEMLGDRLGKERNVDAPAAVIRSGCAAAMEAFVSSFKYQQLFQKPKLDQAQIDAMVLHAVKEPGFFEADAAYPMRESFLELLGPDYRSTELYQLFYDGVKRHIIEAPASLGPTFNGHWSVPVDFLLDDNVPNAEQRAAALLPLAKSTCQVSRLSWLLQRRNYRLAFEAMRSLYVRAPSNLPACDVEFTTTIAGFDAAATADAVLERLRRLLDEPEGVDRDERLMAAADAFAGMQVEIQIEHLSLADEVRAQVHDAAILPQGKPFFDRMDDLGTRSREYTPESLIFWIKGRSARMVRESIAHGVDVNVVVSRDKTALFHAIKEGRTDLVQPLVEAGADVNRVVGGAPLISYALCARPIHGPGDVDESTAMVRLLLAHGVRVHELDVGGMTAIQRAAGCANPSTLEALLGAGAEVSEGEYSGRFSGFGTPLHYAARSGRPKNVAYLLDNKAHIDARTFKGATPLCWAVAAGDVETVKLPLDRGANVNLAVDGDVTPVYLAHELLGQDGRPDPRRKQLQALLESHGAFLNPITVAKYQLIGAVGAALFMMDAGKGTN